MKKQHNIESIRDFVDGIYAVFVRDKNEVFRAEVCFQKFGLSVFADDESLEKFKSSEKPVEKNYLMKDDKGWRIQTAFIGNGFKVEELECLAAAYEKLIDVNEVRKGVIQKEILERVQTNKSLSQDLCLEYNRLLNKP